MRQIFDRPMAIASGEQHQRYRHCRRRGRVEFAVADKDARAAGRDGCPDRSAPEAGRGIGLFCGERSPPITVPKICPMPKCASTFSVGVRGLFVQMPSGCPRSASVSSAVRTPG